MRFLDRQRWRTLAIAAITGISLYMIFFIAGGPLILYVLDPWLDHTIGCPAFYGCLIYTAPMLPVLFYISSGLLLRHHKVSRPWMTSAWLLLLALVLPRVIS